MLLCFSYILPDGSIRSCSHLGMDFGFQLDLLNLLIARGHVLVSAVVIDRDESKVDLPLGAFDGQPMGESIKRLQEEYELLVTA